MNTWQKIYNQKISEGLSDDEAYTFATTTMKRRRASFNIRSIIGMDEAAAKEALDENGYSLNVRRRDVGEVGPMYLDWRENRCNVSIVEGKVEQILSMG